MPARLRVGVVYGGRSSEHEVSLASAASVFANLDPTRYDAVPIYIQRDGHWALADRPPTLVSASDVIDRSSRRQAPSGQTPDVHFAAFPSEDTLVTITREPARGAETTRALVGGLKVDVVFPVVHGPYGEDGTLQGLLELANVPYVGAGVLSSALAMDKAMAKVVFAAHGLPVVDYAVVTARAWRERRPGTLAELAGRLGFPVFVKPANLGSSVGISRATDESTLETAIEEAREFDRKVVVETAVSEARELECAVLGNDEPIASVPGEIIAAGEFYDYHAKYIDDRSQTTIPADLPPEQVAAVQSMAVTAYRAIDGAGMARVDFLLEPRTNRLFVNEVNTIPGFTTISMYAQMWSASGLEYPALLDRLIELAIDRHTQKQHLRTSRR